MLFIKKHLPSIIILSIVTFLAYINIYSNELLSDDIDGILRNPNIGNLGYYIKSLSVPNTIRSLNYLTAGFSPWIYHLTSVLFHIANVILVYFILHLLDGAVECRVSVKKLALPSALIFALHPLHVEAVTWISGFSYLCYPFFAFLSIIFFILYAKRKSLIYFLISVFFCLPALMSSEKSAVIPIILLALAISFIKKGQPIRPQLKFLVLPLVIVFLVTGIISLKFIKQLPARIASVHPSYAVGEEILNPATQIPLAITSYFQLILVPYNLTLYHQPFFQNASDLYFTAIITLIYFLSFIFFLKYNKLLFIASSIFLISLFPTLLPYSISWVVAERYIYFGLFGFAVFASHLLEVISKVTKLKEIGTILLIILLSIYFILTLRRNAEWYSQDTLWPATEKYSPLVAFTHNNMGDYYGRHGDYQNAIREFQEAIRLRNGAYPEAIHNMANMYLEQGNASRAAELYEKVISLDPNILETYQQLALTENIRKNYDKAIKWGETALEKNPNNVMTLNILGVIYGNYGDIPKAQEFFQKALIIDPHFKPAIENLKSLSN